MDGLGSLKKKSKTFKKMKYFITFSLLTGEFDCAIVLAILTSSFEQRIKGGEIPQCGDNLSLRVPYRH